ncbi:ABC transporter ATP-binding protein [Anaeromicropila herbilytica]|uniref:Nitrate ABC transporter ATP-binding protein n=1 Tax=Anaeromicropila herbilytica TaxID=2785025 RepID=A0A7R7EMQ6_9FIRM|nr:ABC transporter ATP-binding protein [Anaeromicropila herbilytica]BCN31647.1 nitrate ABC transporter ATP-binding protein [Anaeromicropila herbilytica]
MYIEINNLSKSFVQKEGDFKALQNISLHINQGEFISLLGPSGCGKSTLLNIVAGFEKADSGSVSIDGIEVTAPSSKYVTIFQNYGLLPWRNVIKNVELGLETIIKSKLERNKIAKKYVELVGLEEFEKRHPHELSGGMQQRVSIARALAVNPDIIYMDEPFGALDNMTRYKMQNDIYRIAKSQQKTVIFVTHDIEEAVYLSDRIVIMSSNPGEIKKIIKVELPSDRDRTSEEFVDIRGKVFEAFNMKIDKNVEYMI